MPLYSVIVKTSHKITTMTLDLPKDFTLSAATEKIKRWNEDYPNDKREFVRVAGKIKINDHEQKFYISNEDIYPPKRGYYSLTKRSQNE